MTYYTILNKTIICPLWEEEITLAGKYYYSEEPGHEYEARFSSARCPIIQNLHLPAIKRDKELSYYPFCSMDPCEKLRDFEPIIDVRTGKPPKR